MWWFDLGHRKRPIKVASYDFEVAKNYDQFWRISSNAVRTLVCAGVWVILDTALPPHKNLPEQARWEVNEHKDYLLKIHSEAPFFRLLYIYIYIWTATENVLLEPRPLEDESLHSQLQPSPRMATAAKDRRDTALRTQRVWKPCPEPLPMSKNVRYSARRIGQISNDLKTNSSQLVCEIEET